MQVTVWEKSVKDDRLKNILKSTINNVPDGWVVDINESTDYKKYADLDIVFGSWKDYDVEHHNLKRQIVKNCNQVMILETPLVNRGPVSEVLQDNWFRIGLNGFMSSADFAKIDNDRLKYLKQNFDIPSSPKRVNGGDYILVPLQLPGDASLQGIDINDWAINVVDEIRKITNRKIVLRTPQLERQYNFEKVKNIQDIYFQKGTYENLKVTLDHAYAVVTYSSGMSVEALLNGNRTYVESNVGFKSPKEPTLREVLDKDYTNFGSKESYNAWLYNILRTQWFKEEIENGIFWEDFKCLLDH